MHIKKICINLERRPDRKISVSEEFKKQGINDVEFYNAVDGKSLEPSYELAKLFRFNNFNNKCGVIGCALSHYNLWLQLMNDNDNDAYLIFEDDITIQPNFNENLNYLIETITDNQFNMIYLGYLDHNNFYDHNNLSPKISIQTVSAAYGTHCYIISKQFATELIKTITENGIKFSIDDFIVTYHRDTNKPFKIAIPCFATAGNAFHNNNIDSDIQNNNDMLDVSEYQSQLLKDYELEGYMYIPNYDMIGNDIVHQPKTLISELRDIANRLPNCIAFNSFGYFKHKENSLRYIKTTKQFGIYIKKSITIKLLSNFTDNTTHYYLRLLPESTNLKFMSDIHDRADYYVIINAPNPDAYYEPEKTIVIQKEPSVLINYVCTDEWINIDESKFMKVINHKNSYNMIEWHLNQTIDNLRKITFEPYKSEILSKVISTIVPNVNMAIGDRLRINFIKYAQHLLDMDIYGEYGRHYRFKNYHGELQERSTEAALIPYRYAIVFENSLENNYFTHQIIDCILSETLCFYWGCPNIEDYFPFALYRLNIDPNTLSIDEFDEVIDQIKEAIANNEYEQRLPFIKEAKNKILNDMHFVQNLKNIIDEHKNK